MFSIVDLDVRGGLRVRHDLEAVAPPGRGVVRWIDIASPDLALIEQLRQAFGFHEEALRDCLEFGLRPRLDEFPEYLFLVFHAFSEDPVDPLEIRIHELHAFLGADFLVTIHDNDIASQQSVWAQATTKPELLNKGPGWPLALLITSMAEYTLPLATALLAQSDALERAVIESGKEVATAVDLTPAFRVRRTAISMRRLLKPTEAALAGLMRRGDRLGQRAALEIREAGDRMQRLSETIDEAYFMANNVVSSYHVLQAGRTNEVVKRLTMFGSIFMPLGIIVGFWGQNFTTFLPFDQPWAFGVMLASLILVPLGIFAYFQRKQL
ncbi:MAG: magnesium transporter CorA family protein [Myxococcales bacterium]|nr:magnesium transporter CorA family protein [Myxococcales bacterium]